jgi:hypothetical protein
LLSLDSCDAHQALSTHSCVLAAGLGAGGREEKKREWREIEGSGEIWRREEE